MSQGGLREGAGRPKGTPNKITTETREAFNQLLHDNLPNLSQWVREIAAEDPDKAVNIMIKLAEFVIPKLARVENKLEIKEQKQFIVEILGKDKD